MEEEENESAEEKPCLFTCFKKSLNFKIEGQDENSIEEELNEALTGKTVVIEYQENSRGQEDKNYVAQVLKVL